MNQKMGIVFILSVMDLLRKVNSYWEIKMKSCQDQLDEIKEMYNGRPEGFRDCLKRRSKELCPDYPWSKEPDPFECLSAITSALEGTEMANKECHIMIKVLREKIGMTAEQVVDLWMLIRKNIQQGELN